MATLTEEVANGHTIPYTTFCETGDKMAEYRDMLTYASTLNGDDAKTASQIVFKAWIDLWIECGNSRVPIGEGEDSDKCNHKYWTRKIFLERIINANDKLADEFKGDEAERFKIATVDNLKKHHGGQPRITQAFNYARNQLIKALIDAGNDIDKKTITKQMKQPPLPKKKSNTAQDFLSMVTDAKLKF